MRQEAQQPFARKATQLVILQLGDMRLRYAKQLGCFRLGKGELGDQVVYAHRELHPQLAPAGIGEAEIDECIAGSGINLVALSRHIARRS